jgi:hypothetical protein
MYDNRRYLIIPSSIVDNIDFSQVHETSGQTLRYSVDNSKTFVKYELPNRPDIYSEEYTEHTYEEILEILVTDEWVFPTDYIEE